MKKILVLIFLLVIISGCSKYIGEDKATQKANQFLIETLSDDPTFFEPFEFDSTFEKNSAELVDKFNKKRWIVKFDAELTSKKFVCKRGFCTRDGEIFNTLMTVELDAESGEIFLDDFDESDDELESFEISGYTFKDYETETKCSVLGGAGEICYDEEEFTYTNYDINKQVEVHLINSKKGIKEFSLIDQPEEYLGEGIYSVDDNGFFWESDAYDFVFTYQYDIEKKFYPTGQQYYSKVLLSSGSIENPVLQYYLGEYPASLGGDLIDRYTDLIIEYGLRT